MSDVTIEVPLNEVAPMAKKAIEQMISEADVKWEKFINEFYEKNKNKRHFWFFKLKFPTKHDAEIFHGYVGNSNDMVLGTKYTKLYIQTAEYRLYKDLVKAHKEDPQKSVTMPVRIYNGLMTYNEVQK